MNKTGIVVDSNSLNMTVHGNGMNTVPITPGLTDFLQWLKSFSNVILAADNGRKFNVPVFINTFHCLKYTNSLSSTCYGFIDSINVFKKVFPEQENYKQQILVETILKTRCKDTWNAGERN